MSILLFIQMEALRTGPLGPSAPGYFYAIIEFFSIAVFLLGFGCIYRNLTGVGVVFAGFQMFILISLIQGIPPVLMIVGMVISAIVFLEASQMLVYRSEICEPSLPGPDGVLERLRVDAYLRNLVSSDNRARIKLEYGKRISVTTDWFRFFIVMVTVFLSMTAAIILLGDDPLYYVSILYFILFPMAIIALVLQRRKPVKRGGES
jgi:hypothetical protein